MESSFLNQGNEQHPFKESIKLVHRNFKITNSNHLRNFFLWLSILRPLPSPVTPFEYSMSPLRGLCVTLLPLINLLTQGPCYVFVLHWLCCRKDWATLLHSLGHGRGKSHSLSDKNRMKQNTKQPKQDACSLQNTLHHVVMQYITLHTEVCNTSHGDCIKVSNKINFVTFRLPLVDIPAAFIVLYIYCTGKALISKVSNHWNSNFAFPGILALAMWVCKAAMFSVVLHMH